MRHFKTDLLLIVAAFCLGTFVGMQKEPKTVHVSNYDTLALGIEMGKQGCDGKSDIHVEGVGVDVLTQHGR